MANLGVGTTGWVCVGLQEATPCSSRNHQCAALPPCLKIWMPNSGSELSNQSRKLFSDFVQSFQPFFVMFHFELAMRATRPINAIVLSNLGDFSSKRNETFDDV